mmetsp:Transcript_10776/g.22250  ORF Transcript_10776/g.22250 Transcript_10776/m.22250 type:complete len:203 (-) Transcript_10776:189-797(-)
MPAGTAHWLPVPLPVARLPVLLAAARCLSASTRARAACMWSGRLCGGLSQRRARTPHGRALPAVRSAAPSLAATGGGGCMSRPSPRRSACYESTAPRPVPAARPPSRAAPAEACSCGSPWRSGWRGTSPRRAAARAAPSWSAWRGGRPSGATSATGRWMLAVPCGPATAAAARSCTPPRTTSASPASPTTLRAAAAAGPLGG